ncbi:hypothetical protein [Amycolatopsis sp.]|uniref:hypothetical protein n=1 Tax=Amycolatopsis sp. TaxID=37632 RepID=UPI002CCA684D|nr:hypothetical protein [Amycolatopsis sp.]HVV10235.1 hypothetical protein [Amycolatopsis sp.]
MDHLAALALHHFTYRGPFIRDLDWAARDDLGGRYSGPGAGSSSSTGEWATGWVMFRPAPPREARRLTVFGDADEVTFELSGPTPEAGAGPGREPG